MADDADPLVECEFCDGEGYTETEYGYTPCEHCDGDGWC